MKKMLSLVLVGLIVLGFVVSAFIVPVRLPESGVTIGVAAGERTKDISVRLEQAGIIRSGIAFQLYVWAARPNAMMKAGEYRFKGTMTISSVANQLIIGSPKREKILRIIEGWTNRQIGDYLFSQGVGIRGDIDASLMREGYLFPDTYRVFYDATPQDVVGKMRANFDRKVTQEMRSRAGAFGKSLSEIIIIASILEREVRSDRDRVLVADLFYRRLAANMPLQADSTVNYATGKNSPQASAQDLAIDSPYNTYKYKGLPPGPIGNPGLSAITAALNPEKNPYWYFLTPKDGSVIYSKTFEEHVRNKRKYLE